MSVSLYEGYGRVVVSISIVIYIIIFVKLPTKDHEKPRRCGVFHGLYGLSVREKLNLDRHCPALRP